MSTDKKIDKKTEFEVLKKRFQEKYGEGNVKILILPLDDLNSKEKEVIVKIPDRKVISSYLGLVDKSIEKANNLLLQNCLLTNKEEVMGDDDLYWACANGIASLIKIREARIKN